MKKICFLMLCLFMGQSIMLAQSTEEERRAFIKERTETAKLAKKAYDAKISSQTKKESKRLKKDGWNSVPGALPLEQQLDRGFKMRYEVTENGMPRFLVAQATAKASSHAVAKKTATELARQGLAEQMGSEVCNVIETSMQNNRLSATEMESMAKLTSMATTEVRHRMGITPLVVEAYRDVDGGKEVMVVIAYELDQMKRLFMDAIPNGADRDKMGEALRDI